MTMNTDVSHGRYPIGWHTTFAVLDSLYKSTRGTGLNFDGLVCAVSLRSFEVPRMAGFATKSDESRLSA